MDSLIPEKCRLFQQKYNPSKIPERYPVFLKPEWGQNSNGIFCVKSRSQFHSLQRYIDDIDMDYMVQEAAEGKHEYEIYYLRSPEMLAEYSYLYITRVVNNSSEKYPVNSVYNKDTSYLDITTKFSQPELRLLWQRIGSIGLFRMARVGVKADSTASIIEGNFKIVEINIFLPMPLILLSSNISSSVKIQIITQLMKKATELVRNIPPKETIRWIFFRKLKAHYKVVS